MSIESEVLAKTLHENATLAAEIKRLEAGEEARNKACKDYLRAIESFAEQEAKLRARIALLEAALGLPDGCDVFQLERAMKEGAVDSTGRAWKYRCTSQGGDICFQSDLTSALWVSKLGEPLYGKHVLIDRLYCIKEANK